MRKITSQDTEGKTPVEFHSLPSCWNFWKRSASLPVSLKLLLSWGLQIYIGECSEGFSVELNSHYVSDTLAWIPPHLLAWFSNKWKLPPRKKKTAGQTKPLTSVMVQKIQFRVCLRGPYPLSSRKIKIKINPAMVWFMTHYNDWSKNVGKQYTCMLPQIAGISLHWKGGKVMWKSHRPVFSWVTPHLPTLRNQSLDVNYDYGSVSYKMNFYAVETGR